MREYQLSPTAKSPLRHLTRNEDENKDHTYGDRSKRETLSQKMDHDRIRHQTVSQCAHYPKIHRSHLKECGQVPINRLVRSCTNATPPGGLPSLWAACSMSIP